jgi:hypothetical protein
MKKRKFTIVISILPKLLMIAESIYVGNVRIKKGLGGVSYVFSEWISHAVSGILL